MKLLLCYLIWGYVPKWKVIATRDVYQRKGESRRLIGVRYILQCEQTGDIKMRDCI